MKKRIAAFGIVLAMMLSFGATLVGAEPPYEGYIYSRYYYPSYTPAAYTMSYEINIARDYGIPDFEYPVDMYIHPITQDIYILDGEGASRIVILSKNRELVKVIDKFNENGRNIVFNKPEGIFVTDDGMIYVCDTQNGRIVRCDINGNVDKMFGRPDGLDIEDSETDYLPKKLQIDRSGRMYVIAQHITKGFLELDPDGTFLSFFGAPKVTLNAYQKFMRMLASSGERSQLIQTIPTEYSNVTLDEKGFVFGCISTVNKAALKSTFYTKPGDDSRAETALIRKMSMDGQDILQRRGIIPPVGDVVVASATNRESGFVGDAQYADVSRTTRFVDIAAGKYGIYSAVDDAQGRIFTYDEDGNLLYIFGNMSSQKGTFRTPVAIGYLDDSILVLDSSYRSLVFFEPTDYGRAILKAAECYNTGDYESSEAQWDLVKKYSSTMTYAYLGVGKAMLRTENYDKALENFKVAWAFDYYSKAMKGFLEQTVGNTFTYIFFIIVGLFLLWKVFRGIRRFRRFLKDGVRKVM